MTAGAEAIKKLQHKLNSTWTTMQQILGTIARHPGTGEEIQRFAKRLADAGIKDKDMDLVRRMSGPSGDIKVKGYCSHCGINLYGDGEPDERVMPCGMEGCPHE